MSEYYIAPQMSNVCNLMTKEYMFALTFLTAATKLSVWPFGFHPVLQRTTVSAKRDNFPTMEEN